MTPAEMALLHAAAFDTPRPWSEAEFDATLAAPGSFVLCSAGGFIIGRLIAGEAEVLTLAVDPAQHRRGIARGLLDRFVAHLQAKAAASVFLEVSSENTAAIALYHTAGFKRVGQRRAYYKAPDSRRIDAFVFTRSVGPVRST
ncbi:MAG: ribosomal-protein-alanine N-acetyltransferase [Paracoccaceae bacterium]|jgi:ribosomal-protein-alanine N-acetyltransferase